MGDAKHLIHQNTLQTSWANGFHSKDFELIIYKCDEASNCLLCKEDVPNLATGSKICVSCKDGFKHNPTLMTCSKMCGNGKVESGEKFDDGEKGGVTKDCKGAAENYTCEGGDSTSPSVCKKNEPGSLVSLETKASESSISALNIILISTTIISSFSSLGSV
jgi:hypothetical protein